MTPLDTSELMRIGDAARHLRMSVVGLRKAVNEGRIPSTITGGGHHIFKRADLDAYLGFPAPATPPVRQRVEALYCRVSGSGDQASSLASQQEVLRGSATGPVHRVYCDQASGLNERRKGLNQLLDDAQKGEFTVVRVTHADRLARFGVGYIERCLAVHGVTLEVLHEKSDATLHEELMQDFMSLVASFAGRFYRLRSRDNQRRLLEEASKVLAPEDAP